VASLDAMPAALLVAEPEPDIRYFLEHHLTSDGFEVVGTAACTEALELAERAQPDLVLLAAELGGGAGLDVCRRLREGEPGRAWNRRVPVIVLGEGRGDAIDRVRAFSRGCDDYVERPFHYEELLARIRAVLRRSSPPAREQLQIGELEIDPNARTVHAAGRRIDLSTKEYQLLLKLASDPARVFTKEELLREVWGFRSVVRTRTLDSHASRVRRKLAAATESPYVLNQWGVGYRLMLPA
jgi:DNA-binding response OmpR family regulator